MADALEHRGNLKTYFDEHGHAHTQVAWPDTRAAIDDSASVIVFLTRAFLDGGNASHTGAADADAARSLRREFEYIMRRRGAARMIAVTMEPSAKSTHTWGGVVSNQ